MPRKIQSKRLGSNVGCCGGCWRNAVVATISPAQRDAAQRYCLASSHILIGEACTAIGHGDHIATDDARQAACTTNRSRRGSVIFPAGGSESAQRQAQRVNRAGGVAGVSDVVVGGDICIAAVTNQQTTDGNCLVANPGVFVGERDAGGGRYGLARTCTCQCAHCGCTCSARVTVIGFVHLGRSDT